MPAARLLPLLNLAAKLLLVALLAYAMLNLEMERFAGKAMPARAILYPVSAILIPIGWTLRGRPRPYPHMADLFLVAPFIIDIGGNVLDLYNTQIWFDEAAHATTWMLLVLAFGALILRLDLAPWNTIALSVGFGAVTHILWEIVEFVAMWAGSPGLQLTYGDTIGDLAMSFSGTVVAGLITGWRGWRRLEG